MEKNAQEWDARWWKVIDNDTGKEVENVLWANDETGEYTVHVYGPPYHTKHLSGNISLVNTLWDQVLSVSGEGEYDEPFEVWRVEDGTDMEFIASFSTHEAALAYVDGVKARKL